MADHRRSQEAVHQLAFLFPEIAAVPEVIAGTAHVVVAVVGAAEISDPWHDPADLVRLESSWTAAAAAALAGNEAASEPLVSDRRLRRRSEGSAARVPREAAVPKDDVPSADDRAEVHASAEAARAGASKHDLVEAAADEAVVVVAAAVDSLD